MIKKPYSIGLTGGIGSGKSTAVSFFTEYGAGIIDTDKIAHELVEKNKPAYQTILSHFSPVILNSEDNIDRGQLRKIIFNNRNEREWLESYLHPLIHQEIKKQLSLYSQSSTSYVIIDIPLLNNRADFPFLNRILVIDCPESFQIERVCERDGLTKLATKQMIDSQISRQKRNILADDLIINNKNIEYLRDGVYRLHEHYLKLVGRAGKEI